MTTERRGLPGAQFVEDVPFSVQPLLPPRTELIADFDVSEGIRSRARIQDMEATCKYGQLIKVFLVQSTSLLQKNLENAKTNLEVLLGDLQFLRDQVTIARIYNWDVRQRRIRQSSGTPKDS